jgi:hypothetical protein
MVGCCEVHDKAEVFDRWLAEGFWYVSRWPRECTSHDGWSGERDVIDDGVQVLDELAYCFFTGEPIAGGVGDSDI